MSEAFTEGDRVPLTFDAATGTVTFSPLMAKAYAAYFETGMNALDLPTHLGGLGAPPSLAWGSFEFVIGATRKSGRHVGCVQSRIPSQRSEGSRAHCGACGRRSPGRPEADACGCACRDRRRA